MCMSVVTRCVFLIFPFCRRVGGGYICMLVSFGNFEKFISKIEKNKSLSSQHDSQNLCSCSVKQLPVNTYSSLVNNRDVISVVQRLKGLFFVHFPHAIVNTTC